MLLKHLKLSMLKFEVDIEVIDIEVYIEVVYAVGKQPSIFLINLGRNGH